METDYRRSDVTADIIKDTNNSEAAVDALVSSEEKLETSDENSTTSVKIVDISHDSTKDTDNGDTFECLEFVNEVNHSECVICGNKIITRPHLLPCLHSACDTCIMFNAQTITCPRCKQTYDTSNSVLLGSVTETNQHLSHVSECLLEMSRDQLETKLPAEVSRLDNHLTDLQEENDNTRSKIKETYQSYRAILEQCMNYALEELDARHHRKELAIMDRLEQVETVRRQLELAVNWSDKTGGAAGQERLGALVTQRLEDVILRLQNGELEDMKLNLGWESDKEMFTKCLSDNFGQFTDKKKSNRAIIAGDNAVSPKLLISEHGGTMKDNLVSSLLSPEPSLGHNLTPGLLSLGPLSPLSPVSPALSSPQPRSAGHGPVGSAISSPAHGYRHQLGLSQPDLTLTSPRHSKQLSLTQSDNSNNLDYNLSHLASINLERPSSGQSGSLTRAGFTLADLISNVTDEHVSVSTWDNDQSTRQSNTALSNLTALAKLESPWPQQDPSLLLPEPSMDPVSPRSPRGHHSLSPVMGLSVNNLGPRGTSPMSPIDSLMPGLSSLNLSPTNLVRSPSNSASLGQRNLNSMQIRCKFGQLGPGKGQFNSPHGFCLGVEEEIIVADTNNHRIQVFEKNGTYRYQFGVAGKEEGQLWYPRKVAVMKTSGKFVVCDRGNERSRMQIFTKHGHFVRKIAIRYIDIVAGLAITRDGNIVAVDSVTPTIFVIMEHGELLRWFDCADYMREPSDIAVSNREFYVCDFKGHNVVVFTEEGQFVRRIGCENITNFPNGIDISDAGDILIGDSHGNKFHVVVFANDGTLLGEFECPHVKVSRCCGLKITSEGYVVTLAKNNHHVLVLNTLYIA